MLTSSTLNYRISDLPKATSAPRSAPVFDSIVPMAGFLGAFLLAVGLLGAWGIKHFDTAYSSLISQTALDLDRLHDISYHSGIGFATAIEVASTPDAGRRATLLAALQNERAANDAVFVELQRETTDPRLRSGLDKVLAKRAAFSARSDEFIRSVSGPSSATVVNPDSGPMLQAFLAYQKSCDNLADMVRAKSLQTSGEFTDDARKFRLLCSAAGILPIVLGLLGILVTFYYVCVTPPEADFKD